jgi:hypothetical protein
LKLDFEKTTLCAPIFSDIFVCPILGRNCNKHVQKGSKRPINAYSINVHHIPSYSIIFLVVGLRLLRLGAKTRRMQLW